MGISFFASCSWRRFSALTETGLVCPVYLYRFVFTFEECTSLCVTRDAGKHRVQVGWDAWVTRWGGAAEGRQGETRHTTVITHACGICHTAVNVCSSSDTQEGNASEAARRWRLSTRSQGLCISSNLVFYSHLVNGVSELLSAVASATAFSNHLPHFSHL